MQKQTLVILGRPFLATANASINCRTGVMDVSFGNMKVRLNVFKASHQPPKKEDCFAIDVIDELVEEALPYILTEDPLEACLSHFNFDAYDVDHSITEVNTLLDELTMMDFPP